MLRSALAFLAGLAITACTFTNATAQSGTSSEPPVGSLDELVREGVFTCNYFAACINARTWLKALGYEPSPPRSLAGEAKMASNDWFASALTSDLFHYLDADSLSTQLVRRRFLRSPSYPAAKAQMSRDSSIIMNSWLYTADLRLSLRLQEYLYDTTTNSVRVPYWESGRYYDVGTPAPPATLSLKHFWIPGLPPSATQTSTSRYSKRKFLQERRHWAKVPMGEDLALTTFAAAKLNGPVLGTPDFTTSAVVPIVVYRAARVVKTDSGNIQSYLVTRCAYLILVNVQTKEVYTTTRLAGTRGKSC